MRRTHAPVGRSGRPCPPLPPSLTDLVLAAVVLATVGFLSLIVAAEPEAEEDYRD